MMIESVLEYHRAQPFTPYKLELADGQDVEIRHPECLAYYPSRPRTVGVALPSGGVKTINLLLVVAVEHVNGKPRRRPRRS